MMHRLATASAQRCSLTAVAVATTQTRCIHKGEFSTPTTLNRQGNSHISLPIRSSQRYGGRWAAFRVKAPAKRMFVKKMFTQDPKVVQFQADVWNAQQTLRRKWKSRDFEVVEMPFSLAPPTLRGVIPDIHTDAPQPLNEKSGDYSNANSKVFDREELQQVMYSSSDSGVQPYPKLLKPVVTPMTLDSFL